MTAIPTTTYFDQDLMDLVRSQPVGTAFVTNSYIYFKVPESLAKFGYHWLGVHNGHKDVVTGTDTNMLATITKYNREGRYWSFS